MRTDTRDGRRLLLRLACALLLAGGLATCGSSGSTHGHSGKGGAACSTTQSTNHGGSTDVNPGSGTSDHGDVGVLYGGAVGEWRRGLDRFGSRAVLAVALGCVDVEHEQPERLRRGFRVRRLWVEWEIFDD